MPDDATKSRKPIVGRSAALDTAAVLVEPAADLGGVEADVVAPLDVGDALLGDKALDVPGVDPCALSPTTNAPSSHAS